VICESLSGGKQIQSRRRRPEANAEVVRIDVPRGWSRGGCVPSVIPQGPEIFFFGNNAFCCSFTAMNGNSRFKLKQDCRKK